MTETFNDFYNIVINERPLIDVRAPIEYEAGAFIGAVNLPIMNDNERHVVGICYKEKGSESAVKLGESLVSGEIKEQRIADWIAFIKSYPNCLLYCFKGGQRSKISQDWLKETSGVTIQRLEGGYKAFRNYLIKQLAPDNIKLKPLIVSGYTGSGKTILLCQFKEFIDLEEIANHRGSSFGKKLNPQPTQINFENHLAYRMIQKQHCGHKYMLLEDEGSHIGRNYIPKDLADYLKKSPVVVLHVPFEERLEITFQEYVVDSQMEYIDKYGREGIGIWAGYIREGIQKIKKRLGDERYNRVIKNFDEALEKQMKTDNHKDHYQWIAILLEEYYDPMYKYQLKNKSERIVFEGDKQAICEYLNNKADE